MEIRYSRQAIKFIKKLNEPIKSRIKVGIKKLPTGDIKPLKGSNNLYRLRIGDYRIIFCKVGNIIQIDKIQKRNDVYKRGI